MKRLEGNIEYVIIIDLPQQFLKFNNNLLFKDSLLRQEVKFLQTPDHPNIVKYYGHFPIDDSATGIAMELFDGTLSDLVIARDLNWLEVAYLSHQMLLGLEHLQDDLKMTHRYHVTNIQSLK